MFENQFFSGGLMLAFLGGAIVAIKQFAQLVWAWFERRYTTLILFNNHDLTYDWAEAWVHENIEKMNTGHRRVTVNTQGSSDKTSYRTLPRPGMYTLRHLNKRIVVYYQRWRTDSIFGGSAYHETFWIGYWGKDQTIYKAIIEEGRSIHEKQFPDMVCVYSNEYNSWVLHSARSKRSLDTIEFSGNNKQLLLDDLNKFMESRQKYSQLGIQWKRGYLLHGPPGNGKSSTIMAIASHYGLPLYTLHLSSLQSDQALMTLISKVPDNSIISIEDADVNFEGRKSKNKNISFSTFLNVFDGAMSRDGQLIFVTTNKIDTLDEALIRPGRMDMTIEFGNANKEQVLAMAKRFSNGCALEYNESLEGESMATIQEYYLSGKGQELNKEI